MKKEVKKSGIHLIVDIVAKRFPFSTEDLLGVSKRRDIAEARFIAIHLAILFTRLSKEAIGNHFNGRDKSDVIWAQKQIEDRCKVYPDLAATVNSLCVQLEQTGMEKKERPKRIFPPKKQCA